MRIKLLIGLKKKNKPRERGSRSGENSCCWRSEADPRPALLSPLQLWSARPLAGSDLRPALLCPAPHLQNVSFISCSSVCLRPALTARKRPCSIMNIVYNNKNKTNSSILKSSLNKYMRLSEWTAAAAWRGATPKTWTAAEQTVEREEEEESSIKKKN